MTTASLTLFPKPRRKTNRVRGRTLRVVPIRNSARIYGVHVVGTLEGAQIPARQYSHEHKCWLIPRQHVDQLVTYAEHAEGRIVTVEAVDR